MTHIQLPEVPLTLEGSGVLHQMFRMRWLDWRAASWEEREAAVREASAAFTEMEAGGAEGSAFFALLGHKGDLMAIHFRKSFDALAVAELRLRSLKLGGFLEPSASYLSVVELGLYESTAKTYAQLAEKGFEPGSEEWNAGIEEVLERQRRAMATRLWPEIPPSRYVCFYPMNRFRGEHKNWYQLPMAERQRQMHEHGLVGRRYAGTVKQVISGSIGFDDWEWGVDLFADDPVQFKKIIYEMRFDEVSAVYGLFGAFYFGIRIPGSRLGEFLAGELPR